MKLKSIILMLFLFTQYAFAANRLTQDEIYKIQIERNKTIETIKSKIDQQLLNSISSSSFELNKSNFPISLSSKVQRNDCNDSPEEVSEATCWNKCLKEGNTGHYCNVMCGSTTGAGEASCLDKCYAEGNKKFRSYDGDKNKTRFC